MFVDIASCSHGGGGAAVLEIRISKGADRVQVAAHDRLPHSYHGALTVGQAHSPRRRDPTELSQSHCQIEVNL